MPVIRQEDPGRKEEVVFLPSLAHHPGQALEFGFREPPPAGKQPATDEEESVGHDQAAQAGHGPQLYAQSRGRTAESLEYETLRYPAMVVTGFPTPARTPRTRPAMRNVPEIRGFRQCAYTSI